MGQSLNLVVKVMEVVNVTKNARARQTKVDRCRPEIHPSRHLKEVSLQRNKRHTDYWIDKQNLPKSKWIRSEV